MTPIQSSNTGNIGPIGATPSQTEDISLQSRQEFSNATILPQLQKILSKIQDSQKQSLPEKKIEKDLLTMVSNLPISEYARNEFRAKIVPKGASQILSFFKEIVATQTQATTLIDATQPISTSGNVTIASDGRVVTTTSNPELAPTDQKLMAQFLDSAAKETEFPPDDELQQILNRLASSINEASTGVSSMEENLSKAVQKWMFSCTVELFQSASRISQMLAEMKLAFNQLSIRLKTLQAEMAKETYKLQIAAGAARADQIMQEMRMLILEGIMSLGQSAISIATFCIESKTTSKEAFEKEYGPEPTDPRTSAPKDPGPLPPKPPGYVDPGARPSGAALVAPEVAKYDKLVANKASYDKQMLELPAKLDQYKKDHQEWQKSFINHRQSETTKWNTIKDMASQLISGAQSLAKTGFTFRKAELSAVETQMDSVAKYISEISRMFQATDQKISEGASDIGKALDTIWALVKENRPVEIH